MFEFLGLVPHSGAQAGEKALGQALAGGSGGFGLRFGAAGILKKQRAVDHGLGSLIAAAQVASLLGFVEHAADIIGCEHGAGRRCFGLGTGFGG